MISIKGILEAPKEQQEFMKEYISMIENFKFNIETYQGVSDDTPIKNADLWIESYIELVPELQEFRDHVRSEMSKLGIEPYHKYTYKEDNHYIYSNKRQLENFKLSLKTHQ